jgi:hypothetical protein
MSNSPQQARVEGKMATEARTAWLLEVGPVRVRCLREQDCSYVVQQRDPRRGWCHEIGRGSDPVELLARVARTTAFGGAARRLSSQ